MTDRHDDGADPEGEPGAASSCAGARVSMAPAGDRKSGRILPAVEVVVPHPKPRLWQRLLVERLRSSGYDVAVRRHANRERRPLLMGAALACERKIFRRNGPSLASITCPIDETPQVRKSSFRLDLSGEAPDATENTVRLAFDGSYCDQSVLTALASGRLPVVHAVFNRRQIIATAAPMVDRRESIALGSDDVLARAITLTLSVFARFASSPDTDIVGDARTERSAGQSRRGFLPAYLGSALPRLGGEVLRRARFRYAHWRVGYRFTDAEGVAETLRLGDGWSELPDTGDRFYADPFPFEWQGRYFIFVEDYSHTTGKAAISVVAFDDSGRPLPAKVVLEQPFHLSYPQVFAWAGEAWMLPEACSSGKLTLYRAAPFPYGWKAEATLLEDREISDATLLRHHGKWWLFATERDGLGSTSDTMIVFHAPTLTGPWTPHRRNPIVIDRAAARPGGQFVRAGARIFLPVQDGTKGYGGGLGLSELLHLDEDEVGLSAPRAIESRGDWPYPQIHTLNRTGRLEVIDGIVAMRKARPAASHSPNT